MAEPKPTIDPFAVSVPDEVQGRPVILASSGGADSLGALRVLHRWLLRGKIPALSVISVDHRIYSDSSAWSRTACAQAAELGVAAKTRVVQLPPADDQGHRSLEARARQARYTALAEALSEQPGAVLVTAHHQEDQAETILLALLRGSGTAGLSAMPVCVPFADGWHWRPFLTVPQAALRAVAPELPTMIPPVDDPSNRDTRFDRNFLRHEILPLLQRRWPSVVAQLSQTAEVIAEERQVLQECAQTWVPDFSERRLTLSTVSALSFAAQANVLRAWIRAQGALMPPRTRLMEFIRQMNTARSDRQPLLRWGRWGIQRDRAALYWLPPVPSSPVIHEPLTWSNPRQPLSLMNGTRWSLRPAAVQTEEVIAQEWLNRAWRVRPWRADDRLQITTGARDRIKTLFQQAGIPVSARRSYGLIEIDEMAAWVPGLGLDRRFRAAPNAGWQLVVETEAEEHAAQYPNQILR